jgi:glycosyltransferase involved in cell wall biosynthesis
MVSNLSSAEVKDEPAACRNGDASTTNSSFQERARPLMDLGRGPLVLLFYDGYEVQARPGLLGHAYSEARGKARFAYRWAKGQQVYTGFYVAFRLLVRALREAGCDIRINNFSLAAKYPDYPIGISGYPSVLQKVKLPNPAIFGPGDYGYPDDVAKLTADCNIRRFIQPSEWAASLYRTSCAGKMMVWPVGIDTDAYPDVSSENKDIDYLIYDKIRWDRETEVPHVLVPITDHLTSLGKSFKILRYGAHHFGQYTESLRRSSALIFVCEHETQGLAYQEALASNVPVLAWDEGVLVDPLQRPFLPEGSTVSSVPYFDERCGERFKIADFKDVLDTFVARRASYKPREYVSEQLSLRRSAETYLDAYRGLM